MTRFGVMKHLRVLEEAGLVVTRRRGREKLHFLNAVPIRQVHDRWVSKYAAPWAAALGGLKQDLEAGTVEKVFEIYIKTTPERLWAAIKDPEKVRKYSFGVEVEESSRVSWKIEPMGDVCHLTLVHDRLRPGASTKLAANWPRVLSGLKTFLETGETLDLPAPSGQDEG
jgi:DNA-binding transcriptional ArsR family regulator